MTGKATFTAWAFVLGALLQPAYGQEETATGGPEDAETYVEPGNAVIADEAVPMDVWSPADSAWHIPAYDTYGDWNTDQIFERRPDFKDTVLLQLAWAECDHAMPTCGKVTSPFGPRHGRHHYGTDLKLQTGDTVVSAFAGKVRISRYHRDFGHVVVVRHANGLETLYGHLSKRLVEAGDDVEAGDVLGLGGSTGRSTGSHLHFETRYLGQPIDPAKLFDLQEGTLHAHQFTVTPQAFRMPPAPPASKYRVRRGDTLFAISRRTGVSVSRLCKINRISKNSTLRIGQQLRIR